MSVPRSLMKYGRFAWGLRDFLGHTITLEEARDMVRRRMARREDNFLRLVRRGIFEHPSSPYLPLLRLARCEMGDLENLVRDKGLEETLRELIESTPPGWTSSNPAEITCASAGLRD